MSESSSSENDILLSYTLSPGESFVLDGYKQTDARLIPSGWKSTTIGNVCSMKSGKTITSARISDHATYPCYGGNGLRGFTDQNTHNGTYALIGRQGALCGNVIGVSGKFFASEHAVVVTPSDGTDIRWLTHALQRMNLNRFSESSAQPGLSVSKVLALPLSQPTNKNEQRAIATALSDVDALLEGLDRLIAKKRDIKQSTMQQLLTGQTRLPGFEGEWKVELLSSVCWFQEGPGVRNHQFTNSGVKLFNGTNIENGRIVLEKTDRHISTTEAYGVYSHFLAEEGDIVIACSGVSVDRFQEKVAVIKLDHLPLCMNTSTMRFKVFESYLIDDFLLHFLRSTQFKKQIGGTATGSAQLNFGPSHVSLISIPIPDLQEQKAIAEILSTCDAEIHAIEQRRKKATAIKQAMMQELLTGRTRLLNVEPPKVSV